MPSSSDGSSTSSSVCSNIISSALDVKPSTSAQALKKNAQDLHATTTTATTSTSTKGTKSLLQMEGQKWSSCFDFDKAMQQLRVAEHHLLQNKCGTGPIVEGSMSVKKCNEHLRQVQSLESCDMHYFGTTPKQKAINAVVCHICSGVYTTMGFSNHMFLRHSNVWHATPTELDITNELLINSQSKNVGEIIKLDMPPPPTPPMRASKSADTTTPPTFFTPASTTTTATANAKHKSKTASSSSSSSSSSSGGGRARSKSRHQQATTNSSTTTTTTNTANTTKQASKASTPERQTSSSHSKNSKKTVASTSKDHIEHALITANIITASTTTTTTTTTTAKSKNSSGATPTLPTLKIQISTKDLNKDKEKLDATTTNSSSKRKVNLPSEVSNIKNSQTKKTYVLKYLTLCTCR